jgi:hypothetical protein
MEMTINNFKQNVLNLLRETVKSHLEKMDPSPFDILNTLDDITLDWCDDGGTYFCKVDSDTLYFQSINILLNERYKTDLPDGITKNEFELTINNARYQNLDRYLDPNTYENLSYNLQFTKKKTQGLKYWNDIVGPVIDRLSQEWNIKKGVVLCSTPHLGNFSIPIDKLKDELSNLDKVLVQIKISKK